MKKFNVLAILVLVAGSAFAQTWTLDKAHSQAGFTITHLSVSDVDGTFKTFDATLTATKEDWSDAVFTFTADVKSVNTTNDMRNEHLQGPEYFDGTKYPTITFKSTSVKKVEGKKYKLAGDLTMKGVTKPITLDLTINGPVQHPNPNMKKMVLGVKAAGTINRKDFGVAASAPGAMLSEDITINVNGEFTK